MSARRQFKPYFIYILTMLSILLIFAVFKDNRAVMFVFSIIANGFHTVSASVCSIFSFSIAELMWTSVFVVTAVCIVVTAVKLIKYGKKRRTSFIRLALMIISAGLSICVGLSVLWGVNYYLPGFEEKSGLKAMPVSAQQLYLTTEFFVEKLRETCDKLERDPTLVCSEDINAVFKKSKTLYRPLEKEYPFLKGREIKAKPMAYSRLFSFLGFTGYFFPFTGESNINVDTPIALIPSTIAHEIAHVRGIAPEQEANFLAVRACEKSGDAFYEYSGWLLGYIHLSNALYKADYEAWAKLSSKLPRQVLADLRADSAYWRQFETPVQEAANKAYSGFLQGYDQALGINSYGACVDLLCAYYGA